MAYDRQIAALTIFTEASGELPPTRRAIAHAILNRVHDGRWGNTTAAVCLRRMQFSGWNDDPMDNADLERAAQTPDDDPVMLDCLSAYDEATSGPDPTNGAMWFYADRIPQPTWAARATFCIKIGSVLFYKDVK